MEHVDTPLRKFRTAQKPRITLKDLSKRVGVTEGQMSRIERSGTTSLSIALKLADITGLPVADFAKPEARP